MAAKKQRALLKGLTTPEKIQAWLDAIDYCDTEHYLSPATLLKQRKGCCFEGALFAAAMLRRLGHRPLILELKAERDDDHIIALYRKNGRWGALAKSNYPVLRARQPLYKTLRELVLTYFEFYYNLKGERSLRSYSVPLDLAKLDYLNWMTDDARLGVIADKLDALRHSPIFPKALIEKLPPMDPWMFKAGMVGTVVSRAYQP